MALTRQPFASQRLLTFQTPSLKNFLCIIRFIPYNILYRHITLKINIFISTTRRCSILWPIIFLIDMSFLCHWQRIWTKFFRLITLQITSNLNAWDDHFSCHQFLALLSNNKPSVIHPNSIQSSKDGHMISCLPPKAITISTKISHYFSNNCLS